MSSEYRVHPTITTLDGPPTTSVFHPAVYIGVAVPNHPVRVILRILIVMGIIYSVCIPHKLVVVSANAENTGVLRPVDTRASVGENTILITIR